MSSVLFGGGIYNRQNLSIRDATRTNTRFDELEKKVADLTLVISMLQKPGGGSGGGSGGVPGPQGPPGPKVQLVPRVRLDHKALRARKVLRVLRVLRARPLHRNLTPGK